MMRPRRDSDQEAPESGLAAYGSLVARASLEHTLGRAVAPPRRLTLPGWRRSWTNVFRDPGRAALESDGSLFWPEVWHYLDLEAVPEASLEVVVYALTSADLARLDRREIGYDRVRLDTEEEGAFPIWGYRAQPAFRAELPDDPRAGAVARSYLELVEAGHRAQGFGETELTRWRPPGGVVVDDVPVPVVRE